MSREVAVIGAYQSGKSELSKKLADSKNKFVDKHTGTIGVDYFSIYQADKLEKIQLWDTSGDSRYQNVVSSYFNRIKEFLLCIDLSKEFNIDDIDINFYREKLKNKEVVISIYKVRYGARRQAT